MHQKRITRQFHGTTIGIDWTEQSILTILPGSGLAEVPTKAMRQLIKRQIKIQSNT